MARQRGVTLIELIVAMVIVGAAIAGLVAAFQTTSRSSADPVVTRQMAAIAEGMMEEVLSHPFGADGTPPGAARNTFTDIWDFGTPASPYRSTGIVDVRGDAVTGLESYNVTVSVAPTALTSVAASDAAVIVVTVSHAGFDDVVLRGWRTRAGT